MPTTTTTAASVPSNDLPVAGLLMKTIRNVWKEFCTREHIENAYRLARTGKTPTPAITKFDDNLNEELKQLHRELEEGTYNPRPYTTVILRKGKTRTIRVSAFRDRIVHHAIILPIRQYYENRFIATSCANRKKKGLTYALHQFDKAVRENSRNGTHNRYVLKCDIKKYFDTIDHDTLITLLRKNIQDEMFLRIIERIVRSYETTSGKGVPLGNWTSQFFANVYLNELDQYVKHELKVRHYIRYVDDFVVIDPNQQRLENLRVDIEQFIRNKLYLELHPDKRKIIRLRDGVPFLGDRGFKNYKLLQRRNILRVWKRTHEQRESLNRGDDETLVRASYARWSGYAQHGNTYTLRKTIKKTLFHTL
jgi:retron-type reverse transcriptase